MTLRENVDIGWQNVIFHFFVFHFIYFPASIFASPHDVSQQQYADEKQLYIAMSCTDSDSLNSFFQSAFLSFFLPIFAKWITIKSR